MERRRVIYTGQVQGVGFRYSTRRIAQRYAVTGFVRNLPNGSVELVAEGEAAEMDRFLAEVAAEMSAYIRHVEIHKETPTSAYPSFEIAH